MRTLFILTIFISSFTNSNEDKFLFKKVDDIQFTSENGKTVNISDIYTKAPVILTLVYSRCSGICYPYISDLKNKLNVLQENYKNYNVLVLSFDPEDNLMDICNMSEKEGLKNYKNWIFGTIKQNQVESFSSAIGFTYSKLGNEYDHNALLIAIDPKGRIIKRLEGFQDISQIKLMMHEMNNDFIPLSMVTKNNSWARCFNYDPVTGKMKFDWGIIIIFLPATFTLLILIIIRLVTYKNIRYGR